MGGGFGVSGAIQGSVTAGAANLATGAAHGLFNLAGKAVSSISDAMKKKKLFKDPNTRAFLSDALYQSVLSVHKAYIDAYNEFSKLYIPELTDDDIGKSSTLFKNITEGRIPKDQSKGVLAEALALNPFVDEYYTYWLKTFGDEDGKLEETAAFFHTSVVFKAKYDLVRKKACTLNLIRDEAFNASVVDIENYARSIGFSGYKEISDSLIADAKSTQRPCDWKVTISNFDDRINEITTVLPFYETDVDECIFIAPNLDEKRISNFLKKTQLTLDNDVVIVFFDETVFGSGAEGVCLTTKLVACNAGDKFVLPYEQISRVVFSEETGKEIKISTKNGKTYTATLTQGNTGSESVAEILQCLF